MSFISNLINRIIRKKLPEQSSVPLSQKSQYNYQKILDWMKNTGLMNEYYSELDKLYNEQNYYYHSQVHGIDHTARVMFLVDLLANLDNLDSHTKMLLLTAARYHDVGRFDDKETKDHGMLGAIKVEELELLDGLVKKDKDIVKFAIIQHSMSREENEKALRRIPRRKRQDYETILSYLKDADALDRVRIANQNMQLDPDRLRHPTSKALVSLAKEYFRDYSTFKELYFKYRKVGSQSPEIQLYYSYISDSILNIDWAVNNQEFLRDLYGKGILQLIKETNSIFLDIIEEPNYLYALSQIKNGDFQFLREKGYNISFETFLSIVSKFRDGTLEKLRSEGKLDSIFSKNTFMQYRKPLTLNQQLKERNISDEELFNLVNKNAYTKLIQRIFDDDYMLYKELYQRCPLGFDILTKDGGIDLNCKSIFGILEVFQVNDLNIFADKGYHFSLNNIFSLFNDITPEEYRRALDSGDVSSLISYNPLKDRDNGYTYREVFNRIRRIFPSLTKDDYKKNYKLYLEISRYNEEYFKAPGIEMFYISDIYQAFTRLIDAQKNLQHTKGKEITFSGEDLVNLLQFSARTNIFELTNESEKDNLIAILIENGSWKNHPSFINYVTKRNRIYSIESIEDILDYNKYCMEKILLDQSITLEDAKKALINSLFRIDIPEEKYTKELEANIVDELYFYQKYRKSGKIKVTEDEAEMDSAIQDLISIMDSIPTIQDFKDVLFQKYKNLSNIQFDTVLQIVYERMKEFSKTDIISELQKTERKISETEPKYVKAPNGKSIPVRVLSGQDFTLSITTVMPFCSYFSQSKFHMDRNLIINNMLNRPLNRDNRCTSLVNQSMMANASSALQDSELRYAYVPLSPNQLSIMGTHDLSTKRTFINRGWQRITSRATQNRSTDDMILGTTEEHNEVDMNDVIPRYVVCIDYISDIAFKKYQSLVKEYRKKRYTQPIELLFIDGKGTYLPKIQQDLQEHIQQISNELNQTGRLSPETFERFFARRGRNITLETIQSINSTSYRNELWQPDLNIQKFDTLASILDRVSRSVPPEHLGDIVSQLDFILYLSSPSNTKFYEHNYSSQINRERFQAIRDRIIKQLEERHQPSSNKAQEMPYTKSTERIDTDYDK